MKERSIAEDVVFLNLCGENSGWALNREGRPMIPPALDAGVAGAYLVELEIAHAIGQQQEYVVTTAGPHHVDADLATVLRQIAAERPRPARWWIERLAATQPHLRQLEHLRSRGLVREYDQRNQAWFFKWTTRYCFAPEYDAEREVMHRLHAAAEGKPTDARTMGLMTILCAMGWYRDGWMKGNEERARQVERLTQHHWIGNAVADTIRSQIWVPT